MIDYKYKELYKKTSLTKKMQIRCSDGSILYEDDWQGESAELTERLCTDSELKFGCCEAATFKIRVKGRTIPLAGKKLTITETLEGAEEAPFMMGIYRVDSDKPTADRRYRDIVAYDAMHDIIHMEVAEWYNSLKFPVTLRSFRDSFCDYMGVDQEDINLINDSMTIEKTIDPQELSGKTVIEAICEINGCFGHIARNGKFRYVILQEMIEGLYPADDLYPSDDLYPADPVGATEVAPSHYISCQYEDYICQHIDKLQIRQEENDIGAISGTGDNCYIIEDNFLVYGKSAADLQTIADNVLSVIGGVWYRPAQVEARGNPCLEVGDGILLHTTQETIYTYILQRTLKGIQALRDSYTAEGEPQRPKSDNGIQKQIIKLKGKTNTLTRTVEETRLEMRDIEKGLSTDISITAQGLSAEIRRATNEEGALAAQISVNAQQILTKVSKNNIVSEINQTAESIKISAARIDLVGLVTAQEFVSKYATIETLNATSAELNNLIATKATIESLNAVSGRVGNLEADHVTTQELNAVSARLQDVETNYISAGTVKADYMEVANWTSGGVIKASRIDATTIVAKLGEFSGQIDVARLFVTEAQDAALIRVGTLQLGIGTSGTRLTTTARWQSITVNGSTYKVLVQS